MPHVIRHQPLLHAVDRRLQTPGQRSEMNPCQNHAANMVPLRLGRATLAFLYAEHLLDLPVVLLDLPPDRTDISRVIDRILFQIIGHHPLRATVACRYSEQLDLERAGKLVHLDELAVRGGLVAPLQVADRLIGLLRLAVIDQSVALEWAVEDLAGSVDVHHQLCGGVPGVHQHHAERQLLDRDGLVEHLLDVLQLGLVVALRIKDPPVDDPVVPALGVHVQAVDHADALDQGVCIAAVLSAHQFDLVGGVLVRDAVVEQQKSIRILLDVFLCVLPDDRRRDVVVLQVAVDGVVREMWVVVSQIGLGVVRLGRHKKLTVITSSRFHGRSPGGFGNYTLPDPEEIRYTRKVSFA